MIEESEFQEAYMQSMLEKAQKMVDKINGYPFVKNAILTDLGIKIEFKDKVDLKDQELLDMFMHGGVIKKADESKDKEESYIKVESIGEF